MEKRNAFHEFLDLRELESFLQRCFSGSFKPSFKNRAVNQTKEIMKKFPRLYRFAKSNLIKQMHAGEISEETIIFRLLIASKWFDIFE